MWKRKLNKLYLKHLIEKFKELKMILKNIKHNFQKYLWKEYQLEDLKEKVVDLNEELVDVKRTFKNQEYT